MQLKRRFPWIAQQNWQDILFIHTPVSQRALRKVVPAPFTIDTYKGRTWISIVLFKATNSRLRYMPEWLSYPLFHQMNIRTYVRFGDERGVYFFSINTDRKLTALGGNAVSLPFRQAPMMIQKENDHFLFSGEQLPAGQKGMLQVAYQPHSPVFTSGTDSLSHFLTERYCIWMVRGSHLVKAPIIHTHWRLQQTYTSIQGNRHFPFPFTDETFSHYSAYKHAMIYPFENVGIIASC